MLSRVVRREVTPQTEIMIAAVIGILAGLLWALFSTPGIAVLLGWDVAAIVYLVWVWASSWRLDSEQTKRRATKFDLQDVRLRDLILISAAIICLAAVVFVLARAGQSTGVDQVLRVSIGLLSIVLSWAILHTVYMLRYAHLYYRASKPPIDFNTDTPPSYADFAYLAFTIGMTFQVSDTPLTSPALRRVTLRHALLSFVFSTGILAVAVNLVASISSKAG
jgi:uncharacterized membrane protein